MTSNIIIVGIDEVGRGSWAGPVVSSAVVLEKEIPGLRDSKKLSFKKRIELDKIIRQTAKCFAIGEVSSLELDRIGLTQAVSLSMKKAIDQLDRNNYSKIIIDGNFNYLPDYNNVETLIKADDKIPSVMAASIIAKVYRDNLMIKFSKDYPVYGFETNFGYGTKHHLLAIQNYGISDIHRRSFKPVKEYEN